jgi:NAD(P)-dependent dehydrogenase (short-subunit alcohol dehydrogenase family)
VKVIVIGASGTIGSAVVEALRGSHEVVPASRRGDPRVDLADPGTIAALFRRPNDLDAVVCCAASAPLGSIADTSHDRFRANVEPKLLGQVAVAVHAAHGLKDGGSITLTSGVIPEDTAGAAGGAMVNAGLDAFVHAAARDLGRGLRINAVSPSWVAETLADLDMDTDQGVPVRIVARAYVEAVEGTMHGEILRPGR